MTPSTSQSFYSSILSYSASFLPTSSLQSSSGNGKRFTASWIGPKERMLIQSHRDRYAKQGEERFSANCFTKLQSSPDLPHKHVVLCLQGSFLCFYATVGPSPYSQAKCRVLSNILFKRYLFCTQKYAAARLCNLMSWNCIPEKPEHQTDLWWVMHVMAPNVRSASTRSRKYTS